MRAVLISTYEVGRQPFGLASAAAWLGHAGFDVSLIDTSRQPLRSEPLEGAALVGFHLPMHTATRLAMPLIAQVRAARPEAWLCAFGLYAPGNAARLTELGVDAILDGEFEADLVEVARRAASSPRSTSATPLLTRAVPRASQPRLAFRVPDRRGLPPPSAYAALRVGAARRIVGYTEASRGCKHTCRHCPVVPVYDGQFRIVPIDVVVADVRQQVAAGAEHITFGDPDFFNGIRHATAVIEALAVELPGVTYDVTIKVEHLLRHADQLARLRRTGCAFVTTAFESFDDAILARLRKGHTRADALDALARCRAEGLPVVPTFVPFTPWTTVEGYSQLLTSLVDLDLADCVAPIQLAIRLLLPGDTRLLELGEIQALAGPFDPDLLVYPWRHPDPRVDELQREVEGLAASGGPRAEIFGRVWTLAHGVAGRSPEQPLRQPLPDRATVPYLEEPWYC